MAYFKDCVALLRPAENWDEDEQSLCEEDRDRLAPALGLEDIDFDHPFGPVDTIPWILATTVWGLKPLRVDDGGMALAFDRKEFERRLEDDLAMIARNSGAGTIIGRLDAAAAVERERGVPCALAEEGVTTAAARSLAALLWAERERLDGQALRMDVLPAR